MCCGCWLGREKVCDGSVSGVLSSFVEMWHGDCEYVGVMKIPRDWKIVIAVGLLGVGCLVASHQVKRPKVATNDVKATQAVRVAR